MNREMNKIAIVFEFAPQAVTTVFEFAPQVVKQTKLPLLSSLRVCAVNREMNEECGKMGRQNKRKQGNYKQTAVQ